MAVNSGGMLDIRGERRCAHPFEDTATLRFARRMVVYTPSGEEITALSERARRVLPMIAEPATVHRIASLNPDVVWAIARREHFDVCRPRGEGFVGFLMLNREGRTPLARRNIQRR